PSRPRRAGARQEQAHQHRADHSRRRPHESSMNEYGAPILTPSILLAPQRSLEVAGPQWAMHVPRPLTVVGALGVAALTVTCDRAAPERARAAIPSPSPSPPPDRSAFIAAVDAMAAEALARGPIAGL